MSTLVTAYNCRHWSLHTTVIIGHCIQLSTLVTAYNCRQWSLHTTVDIGNCIQLSTLVTTYNCQQWSLHTTINIGHCIHLSTLVTAYNCQHSSLHTTVDIGHFCNTWHILLIVWHNFSVKYIATSLYYFKSILLNGILYYCLAECNRSSDSECLAYCPYVHNTSFPNYLQAFATSKFNYSFPTASKYNAMHYCYHVLCID